MRGVTTAVRGLARRMRRVRWLAAVALLPVVAGCATEAPFGEGDAVATDLTPRAAAEAGDARGAEVIWAGRILRIEHLSDRTELEVVGYPRDRAQRPRLAAATQGRFLVVYPGFLESADYQPGRLVTVAGPIEAMRTGQVGEHTIRYPVVATEAVHLWPLPEVRDRGPRVQLGIGVMLSR